MKTLVSSMSPDLAKSVTQVIAFLEAISHKTVSEPLRLSGMMYVIRGLNVAQPIQPSTGYRAACVRVQRDINVGKVCSYRTTVFKFEV